MALSQEQLEELVTGIKRLSTSLYDAEKNLKTANTAIKTAGTLAQGYKHGIKEVNDAVKEQHDNIQKLAQRYKLLGTGQRADIMDKKQLVQLSRAIRAASEQEIKALKKITGEYKTLGTVVKDFSKSALGGITKIATGFGLAVPSVNELTKKLIEYRSVQFSVSRTQQVFSKGMDDMSTSMQFVKKNTILSKQQFVGLVDAFQKGYIGAAKSSMEIAKVGATLQRAFGPNIEEITKRSNDLLGIMNKFPALGNIVRQAGELAQFGGDPAKLKQYQSQILSVGRAIGLSAQEWDTVAKMTTKSTEEQRKQQQMAEKLAKAQQYFADIMINVSEQLDDITIKVSDWIQKNQTLIEGSKKVLGFIAQYPIRIAAAVALITKLNLLAKGTKLFSGMLDSRALRRQRGMSLAGGLGMAEGGGGGGGAPVSPPGTATNPAHVIVTNPAAVGNAVAANSATVSSAKAFKDSAVSMVKAMAPLAAMSGGLYLMMANREKESFGGQAKAYSGAALAGAGAGYLMGRARGGIIGTAVGVVGYAYSDQVAQRQKQEAATTDLITGDAKRRKNKDTMFSSIESRIGTQTGLAEAQKKLKYMEDRLKNFKSKGLAPKEIGFDMSDVERMRKALSPENVAKMNKEFKELVATSKKTDGIFLIQKQFAEMEEDLKSMLGMLNKIDNVSSNAFSAMSDMGIADPDLIKSFADMARNSAKAQQQLVTEFQQKYFSEGGMLDQALPAFDMTFDELAKKVGMSAEKLRNIAGLEAVKVGPAIAEALKKGLEAKTISSDEVVKKISESAGLAPEVKEKLSAHFKALGSEIKVSDITDQMNMAEMDLFKEKSRFTDKAAMEDALKTMDSLRASISTMSLMSDGSKEQTAEIEVLRGKLNDLKLAYLGVVPAKEKLDALSSLKSEMFGKQAASVSAVLGASETAMQGVEGFKKEMQANREEATRNLNIQMDYNNVLEQRLSIERELMEAAQFGMGASIDMMQKQVNLQAKIIQQSQVAIKNTEDQIAGYLEANKVDKKQIPVGIEKLRNAKDYAEAVQIAKDLGVKDGKEQAYIADLTKERTKLLTQQMQSQKKIYDLTKEMREGYLDAMKEMAWGAGEFEKIIGTQEMGVTQLMDAVNSYSATGNKNMLNTMMLGGYQDPSLTAAGVGASYAGMYSVNGAVFESGAMAEAKNRRNWGYGQTHQNLMDAISGKTTSVVGSGLNTDVDATAALRDAASNTEHTAGEIKTLRENFANYSEQGFFNALLRYFGVIAPKDIPATKSTIGANIVSDVLGFKDPAPLPFGAGVLRGAIEAGKSNTPAPATLPKLGDGGTVKTPTAVVVGDGGEPEHVIPDSMLKKLLKSNKTREFAEKLSGYKGVNAPYQIKGKKFIKAENEARMDIIAEKIWKERMAREEEKKQREYLAKNGKTTFNRTINYDDLPAPGEGRRSQNTPYTPINRGKPTNEEKASILNEGHIRAGYERGSNRKTDQWEEIIEINKNALRERVKRQRSENDPNKKVVEERRKKYAEITKLQEERQEVRGRFIDEAKRVNINYENVNSRKDLTPEIDQKINSLQKEIEETYKAVPANYGTGPHEGDDKIPLTQEQINENWKSKEVEQIRHAQSKIREREENKTRMAEKKKQAEIEKNAPFQIQKAQINAQNFLNANGQKLPQARTVPGAPEAPTFGRVGSFGHVGGGKVGSFGHVGGGKVGSFRKSQLGRGVSTFKNRGGARMNQETAPEIPRGINMSSVLSSGEGQGAINPSASLAGYHGGEGGNGNAVITLNLAPEITAKVDVAHGLSVNLHNSTGSKGLA